MDTKRLNNVATVLNAFNSNCLIVVFTVKETLVFKRTLQNEHVLMQALRHAINVRIIENKAIHRKLCK